ncbi:MAG: type II restriction endonuclease subunit R [Treponema sp.]|nr:type II restriction endonuclease subunit R [Treponema sp.]
MKKDDQIPGNIPFVMAGTTNTGVVNYISNPIASFPENSITVDIFGNVFYRDYAFGAGDDTGVYWNDKTTYSKNTMIFFSISMAKALLGKFSFGKKLRSSQSLDFTMLLPTKNGQIDFEFMESFIRELEEERIRELTAYLTVSGFDNCELSNIERKALEEYSTLPFEDYPIVDIFDVKNTANILSNDITENSGTTPYLCASAENNAVSSYITYDEKYLEKGNCIFIGGKTFVVSYQEKDFYSNDSHNLALYLKDEDRTRLNQLYLATCIYRSLCHKYSWGNSVSKAKIKSDYVSLPTKDGKPDYSAMATFISAIQKLVIKDVVLYADRKIDGTKKIVANDDCQDNLRK